MVGSAFGENGVFSREAHPGEAEYLENLHSSLRDIYDVRVGDKVRGKSNSRVSTGIVTEVNGEVVKVDTGKEIVIESIDKLILVL
jgi:hypothetical protein